MDVKMMLLTEVIHYENLPTRYTCTKIFSVARIENFIGKILIFFLFLLET